MREVLASDFLKNSLGLKTRCSIAFANAVGSSGGHKHPSLLDKNSGIAATSVAIGTKPLDIASSRDTPCVSIRDGVIKIPYSLCFLEISECVKNPLDSLILLNSLNGAVISSYCSPSPHNSKVSSLKYGFFESCKIACTVRSFA